MDKVSEQTDSVTTVPVVRYARNLLFYACGVAATCVLLEWVVLPIYPSEIQKKFDYFAAHKDEYDVVFIGSSQIQSHLYPKLFDGALRRRGHVLKSYNFGIRGMTWDETDAIIDPLLSLNAAHLRYFVVELGVQERFGRPRWVNELFTERQLWWHTPRQTLRAVRIRFAQSADRDIRTERFLLDIKAMLLRTFHIGAGRGYLQEVSRRLGFSKVKRYEGETMDEGFEPNRGEEQTERFKRGRERYEGLVELMIQQQTHAASDSMPHRRVVANQVRRIRSHGVEPIYLVPPFYGDPGETVALAEAGIVPALFSYGDPRAYPEYYKFENRHDPWHLNLPTARKFTEEFANDFADYLEGRH